MVCVLFWGKFLQKFFEIPNPQVASFEEIESGGGEFAVSSDFFLKTNERKNFLPLVKIRGAFKRREGLSWNFTDVLGWGVPCIL